MRVREYHHLPAVDWQFHDDQPGIIGEYIAKIFRG